MKLSADRHLQRHPGQGHKGRGESPEEKVTIKLPRKLAARPVGGTLRQDAVRRGCSIQLILD